MLSAMPQGIRRGLSAGYIALIALLSLLPAKTFEDIPTPFDSIDKVVHVLMYGLMAFILCWTFHPEQTKSDRRLVGIFLFCAMFGLLMEILQGIFPQLNRAFSWSDEAANITGATVFLIAWRASRQSLEKVP